MMELQVIDKREVKETQIETFNNTELKINVRTIKFEDGTIGINAEDAAKGFGFTTIAKSGNECVRWSRINEYLQEFGFDHKWAKDDYIPESLFYMLGMKANNKTAQDFQKWLAMEVIPSIRQTGGYIPHNEDDDDATIMAKALLISQKTIEKKDNKIKALEKETLKLVDVIESQKPKLEYLDQILSCDDALLVTNIAFDYGLTAQALNKILCEERIQRKLRGQWVLYSDYLGKGYTKTETEIYGDKPRAQTLWTQKGRMLIHEVLTKREVKAMMDLELAEA
ncbi:hypothetical protein D4A35_03385 [Paraclostridium bifermentans]|uniref:Bro-N domain-containing protein n=1 Tax=Paraclostridium bifermentans TaxID=1490 RepID=A0A5P3XD72_PARBF|nr:phage antirepressor KilAC domain-containing protein [Paraclostridium bifermentans]QEZ68025.1 hypothetical protein D4A35_03385 [Paraclostridium bifermentans]